MDGLKHEILLGVISLVLLWREIFPLDKDGLTITSGAEGHSGDGVHGVNSLHYKGQAVDLRVRDVPAVLIQTMFIPEAKNELGPNYDIVFEGDHIHVEYDPKPKPVIA